MPQVKDKVTGRFLAGKKYTCLDCTKFLSTCRAVRCHSCDLKNRWQKAEYIKFQKDYNKGNKRAEGHTPWNRGKKFAAVSGERNYNWKGGVTNASKLERCHFQKLIQPQIFARDNYTCQVCGEYGGYLHADHIQAWAEYPELRFQLDNCRTLCRACHYYITFKRKMPSASKWGLNGWLDKKVG